MNAICVEAGCSWNKQRACPECLDEIADRHRNEGHEVRVVGVDETSHGAIVEMPNRPFPQWMRGSSV